MKPLNLKLKKVTAGYDKKSDREWMPVVTMIFEADNGRLLQQVSPLPMVVAQHALPKYSRIMAQGALSALRKVGHKVDVRLDDATQMFEECRKHIATNEIPFGIDLK